ncbi:MAG TPA: ABC transporter ATP-binding protein [Candidatus Dormibacteraeota bacterium]|nr:ABC transporter ATP-binding protein [Candidatus Dormibacteraeota bacterium]
MIQTFELTKHYRQGDNLVRALDGVNITIDSGEFVSVIGRSGSGKSTLLDVLGLLLRPTSGRVVIDGIDTSTLGDGRRSHMRGIKLGFVFQEYNLLPTMTALDNVMLPLTYAGKADRNGKQRVISLMEEVGLADRAHHRPDQLSGGQQQRVAIARALVNQPSVVFADEPTGAVDTETSAQLADTMKRMNREHGTTFVIVTHDLDLAAQTDRIIRLRDGRVFADETSAQAVA